MPYAISNIISDPFALGTLSIAWISLLIAFVAAIVVDSQGYFPKFAWWGILFQLILNIFIGTLYLTDTIELYRLLTVGMTSISFLYSTNSSNNLVYSSNPARLAAAAGCILLSIINLLWLIYFGADPNSPTSQWIDSFATRQRTLQTEPVMMADKNMNNSSEDPFSYSGHQQPYMASSTQLNGLENGEEPSGQGYYSSAAAAINKENDLSDAEDDEDVEVEDDVYPFTVKALYNYDANPADATELSFTKGEILKVQSITGRWWQLKNADGKVGILPSNYVEQIEA